MTGPVLMPMRSSSVTPWRSLEPFVQLGQPGAHAQRGAQRPGRVVLVHAGHAEGRHDRVADELLDGAALGLDLGAHGREEGAHDLLERFRVEPLAERGRAGDVREQHGHDLALLGRLGGDERELRAAAVAEARLFGILAPAAPANRHAASVRTCAARGADGTQCVRLATIGAQMLRKDAKMELLRHVTLFAGCSKKELGQIALIADEIDFPAGKTLIKQGDPGRQFFVVIEGEVKVTKNGKKLPLARRLGVLRRDLARVRLAGHRDGDDRDADARARDRAAAVPRAARPLAVDPAAGAALVQRAARAAPDLSRGARACRSSASTSTATTSRTSTARTSCPADARSSASRARSCASRRTTERRGSARRARSGPPTCRRTARERGPRCASSARRCSGSIRASSRSSTTRSTRPCSAMPTPRARSTSPAGTCSAGRRASRSASCSAVAGTPPIRSTSRSRSGRPRRWPRTCARAAPKASTTSSSSSAPIRMTMRRACAPCSTRRPRRTS